MNYESRITTEAGASRTYIEQDLEPRTRRIWPLLLGLLLIAAILFGAWYAFSSNKAGVQKTGAPATKAAATGEGEQVPNVTVLVPGTSVVSNIVNATGVLAARRDLPVGAVGEGGMVTRVLVDAGSWVRAGQILAIVDRQVQAQQSTQIAAQIRVAEADARLAENELGRARALAGRGFVSKADVDRKTAQRDGAMARVRVARAQFAENSARIRRLDIRAPSSGLILARSVEPGQVVGAGSGALFRIAQNGEMEVKAQVAETDLLKTAVGYRASITPVGSQQSYSGRVWQIAPIIDPQTRQGVVRISLPYNAALRPGGFAGVKIDSGAMQAPLLPESAVQSDPKGNYVYLVGPDNKVVRRDVVVGIVNETGVSIIGGLDGTEQVVLSAGGFLNPGEKVAPKRATAGN